MSYIARFQQLINQILEGSEFPALKWGQDSQFFDNWYSYNKTSDVYEFSEANLNSMASFINKQLKEMGMPVDFPFIFRPSSRAKNTSRIGFNSTENKALLESFFAQLDAVRMDLNTELYDHPTDPSRVVCKANYAIRRKISVAEQAKRVTFLLDKSESMRGEKLSMLKQFAKDVIKGLSDRDLYNIILFNQDAQVLVKAATPRAKDKRTFKFDAEGNTNLLLPFELMVEEEVLDPQRRNVVIFVTDGQHTAELVSEADIPEKIKATLPEGTCLITIGVGADYDVKMIRKLSDLAHVPTPIHVKSNASFGNALAMTTEMSAPQSMPLKLQLLTQHQKKTIRQLGCLKLNSDLSAIVEIDKSSLTEAELILIDATKRCVRSKLNHTIKPEMPISVLINWLIAKIHATLDNTSTAKAEKEIELGYVQTVIDSHLKLTSDHPQYEMLQNLLALYHEAKQGVEQDDQDALLNATFLSNPTQQDYIHFQAAQPLSWSQAVQRDPVVQDHSVPNSGRSPRLRQSASTSSGHK